MVMEPDLADLLAAWLGLETETTPERLEALLARLKADERFRRSFVAEIRMLGMLKTVQSPESRWLRLEDELGWSSSESTATVPLEDRIDRELEGRSRSWFLPSRSAIRWGSIAASILIAATLGLALWSRPVPEPARIVTPRPYPRVDSSVGLAMVVKLDGPFWQVGGDQPRPMDGDILGPGRFRLGSGRAVLSMLTGVVLDVEGPADVELISDTKVLCHQGRIRARVPAGAEGFVVLGPSSAVVDLGTEFALNVGLDGKTQGRVFLGKLEAAVLNATGSPRRSYLLDAGKANASKAFEIDARAGKIEAVPTSEDFLKASEPATRPLILDADYPASVLRSRPWGYWRFESILDGSTPNEIPGRPPLKATGPIKLVEQGEGSGNRSAEFLPGKEPQFLALQDDWMPNSNPGYAVEFWCLTRSIGHATLASLVSPRETDHHVFLMELTSRNRLTIHKPASIRLLHRWPAGWEGGDNTYSSEPYIPYRWHHFVGQVKQDQIELYKDGEVSSQASATPDRAEIACQFVLGRLTALPGTGLSVDRPFVGLMDEVALYDRPLSIEEIRDHFRLGARLALAK
jgi:hypothetical protein